MAHPVRADAVRRLREQVPTARVGWDIEGAPRRDHERVWRTARRAWSLYDPRAAWHVLLQDDAKLCPGFFDALPDVLERHTDQRRIVSFYLGTTRPMPGMWQTLTQRADREGATWIVGPMVMWGVALAVPTTLIPEMIAWGDSQRGIPDDMRVGRWGSKRKVEAWYPWPSLVDHFDDESLVGHGKGRVARRFAADGVEGVDWSGGGVVRWG